MDFCTVPVPEKYYLLLSTDNFHLHIQNEAKEES